MSGILSRATYICTWSLIYLFICPHISKVCVLQVSLFVYVCVCVCVCVSYDTDQAGLKAAAYTSTTIFQVLDAAPSFMSLCSNC